MKALTVECERCNETFTRPQGSHTTFCSVWCRFMSKVRFHDECWEWTGAHSKAGYGQIKDINGRVTYAHRWSYQNLGRKALNEGLQIDHLCRNRGCVNPRHLEQVTSRENSIRGHHPNFLTLVTGFCQRGHSMKDAYQRKDGSQTCRTCTLESQRVNYAAKKAAPK